MLIMRLRRTGQFAVNHFSRISPSLSLLLPSPSPSLLSSFLRSHSRHSAHTFRTVCVTDFLLFLSIRLSCSLPISRIQRSYTVRYFHLTTRLWFSLTLFSSPFSHKINLHMSIFVCTLFFLLKWINNRDRNIIIMWCMTSNVKFFFQILIFDIYIIC